VYYSAFIPVAPDPRVPTIEGPPLLREHRLYQADWLFRFYGFTAAEVFSGGGPYLDPDLDPKCAWALRNLAAFPLDINTANYGELLRVPGIGPSSASRILRARRLSRLRVDRLAALGVVMKRARSFVCDGSGTRGMAGHLSGLDDVRLLRSLLLDRSRNSGGGSGGCAAASQLHLDFGGGVP
ncbi:MAG: hypothetical protein ACOYM2_20370, partial [Rectinemataceae bacterium]